MPKIIANFTSAMGPNEPRNQTHQVFFPATSNDGPAKTARRADVPFVQASKGTMEGQVVAMVRPNLYNQTTRVYNVSRRMFPRAL